MLSYIQMTILGIALAVLMAGCNSTTGAGKDNNLAKPELQFLDFQSFDKDLHTSLSAPLSTVEVTFLDRVSPNGIPDRLQKWMAAVEADGGQVQVIEPPPAFAPKDPFLLVSIVSSLWSATKVVREAAQSNQFKAAKGYDAKLILKNTEQGGTVVDKVIFVERKK
jgi:predicted small secreted protein